MKRAASRSPVRDEEAPAQDIVEQDEDDEEEEFLICEETLADVTSEYRFKIKLLKHCEFETVVRIAVGIEHDAGEVGSLRGLVVDRSSNRRPESNEVFSSASGSGRGGSSTSSATPSRRSCRR